ncbi:GAF domain-containing protein [Anseongella ginsenosidimutans]|uniref:GAF domain-containing protein n=1 Tax=Anseongella ginsenosidimutans TaxID=496056 RepID=A0A4R3KSQ1_9SPHI|nr:GAF domain-containing protein [Anseongella ginsenosidimutans]QEC53197.1 GAF domain-containing protein [Anseongella ginsenosidimutans]TCS87826.1 GAF domain-containing protein [Anseongella ginsenosidimutans]
MTTKEDRYKELLPRIKALTEKEPDPVANMANISAVLKEAFNFLWVGFYLVKDDQLVLGPFQGPVACTRIDKGKGVCGTAWAKKEIIIVEDVDQFEGHIACNNLSRSEIVVPVMKNGTFMGVLDVDSDKKDDFNDTDAAYLLRITDLLPL